MGQPPQLHGAPTERAEKRVRAYELSLRAHSYREIARIMTEEGYSGVVSPNTIGNLITEECDHRVLPLAAEWRQRTIDRLTIAINKLMEQIEDPRQAGRLARNAEVLAKTEERLSKMLGADAPVQVEAQVTETTQADLELQELLREAKARAAVQLKQANDAARNGHVG